jgi:hypothetical protein
VQAFRTQDRAARISGEIEKEGFDTGVRAINPFTNDVVPVWVANFVLGDYGTGAVMAVPAHDQRDYEFARKFKLPIRVVVSADGRPQNADGLTAAVDAYGVLVESGEFSGLPSGEAQKKMVAVAQQRGIGEATIQYRLKDWGISRQRYWGTPIPMIYCEKDGIVPVPYEDLPVELPEVAEFTGRGESPLAQVPAFVNVACPKCHGPARRETDTMDTFVDSSWYFYRFVDPRNGAGPFDPARLKYWLPVDFYIGGIEHRDPALDLLALLRPGVPRSGTRRPQRAVYPAAHAGNGAEGRRRHVQVEGERGRSRRDDGEVRRRCAAPLRHVRRPAGKGDRVDGCRDRGQLSVPVACLASGRSLERDHRRRGRRQPRRVAIR